MMFRCRYSFTSVVRIANLRNRGVKQTPREAALSRLENTCITLHTYNEKCWDF